MMSETTDSETVEQPPCETIQKFLNAGRDGYVETTETRFREDGTAKIALTHTHQGAFQTVSTLARRFGLVPKGNRDAGGQRFRHIAGTTPTLTVEYHPDRYNVVMVGNPEYTGPLPYDPHPLASAVTREQALDEVEKRRTGEQYRDDVEYRIQSCESQDLIAREDEREPMTDGGEDVSTNPDKISEDDLPDSAPDILGDKITAALNMALSDSEFTPDATLVEAADMAGLKYEKLAEIARDAGLDVDAMNVSGLGIADSEDDIQRREPDSVHERFCDECDGMVEMDVWKGERGGIPINQMECQNCGEGGVIFHMTPTSIHSGILLEQDERKERLKDLRERGVHPQVSERSN